MPSARKPPFSRRTDPNPDKVSRLIDIQSKLASGKGAGYERWVKVFNLKQLSKSVALLSEHGVHTEAELADQISRFKTESSESLAVVKNLEIRIDENRERSRHVSAYIQKPEGCPAGQNSEEPGDFSRTAPRRADSLSGGSRLFQGPKNYQTAQPETAES